MTNKEAPRSGSGSRPAVAATPERRSITARKASPVASKASAVPKASTALSLALQVGGYTEKRKEGGRRSFGKTGNNHATSSTSATLAAGSAYPHHVFDPQYRITASEQNELSPRLLPLEFAAMDPSGAPMLPPQPTVDPEVERFCTAGPTSEGPGGSKRSSLASPADLPFDDLVSRLEKAMSQASLLLNDRLRSLKMKCHNVSLTPNQEVELCDISYGVAAAAYHVQKWAHALGRSSSSQVQQPTKPSLAINAEEAFASVHFSLPKLMVNTSEAQKCLAAIVNAHGVDAEAQIRVAGISVDDIRAVTPHLERLLLRLGRLSTAVKPSRTNINKDFTWHDEQITGFLGATSE